MELWDVYDKQGNVTGKVKTRNDVFEIGEYHLGVSLWIANKNGELLIQKRAVTKRIKPGIWSVTGGAARAGESSQQACIREVVEEIGLSLNQQDIHFLFRKFGKDIIFDDYITIRDFPLTDTVLQIDEVSEVRWASIDEIKALFYKEQFLLDDVNALHKVVDYINDNLAMQC